MVGKQNHTHSQTNWTNYFMKQSVITELEADQEEAPVLQSHPELGGLVPSSAPASRLRSTTGMGSGKLGGDQHATGTVFLPQHVPDRRLLDAGRCQLLHYRRRPAPSMTHHQPIAEERGRRSSCLMLWN